MRARPVLLFLLLALVLGAAGAWAATRRAFRPAWQEGERPPNVLLVSMDTLRADHMGVYGYGRPTTPRIDEWAAKAVVFDDAQASTSWTLPSLATLLTSYSTSTHGCWTFDSRLDPSFTTLTEILTSAGYDSAAVTTHVFLARRYGLQQGFVHFDDEFAQPVMEPHLSVTSDHVSDRGIRFLRQKAAAGHDEVPWFLWLHYFDPHDLYLPHAGISEAFGTEEEVDLYDGEIRFTDLHVGRVLDALRELGMEDETIVVLVADHGEEFGDHGGKGHGHTLHRELVRVPLIVRAPGFAPRRVAGTVRTVDVMPTLLELAGLPAPEGIEGHGLVPALRGEAPPALPALAELGLLPEVTASSVQQRGWKLLVDAASGEERLYDVGADPREERDLAAERPQVAAELRATLALLVRRARAAAERFEHAGSLGLTESQLESLRGLGYLGGGERR